MNTPFESKLFLRVLMAAAMTTGLVNRLGAQPASTGGNSAPAQVFHTDGTPAKLSELPPGLAVAFAKGPQPVPDGGVQSDRDTSIADAKRSAKGKDSNAAELAVTRSNLSKPNTADWHFETTGKLLEAARQLSHDGDSASATALTKLCLQHLDQAATLTKDNRQKAQAKAQTAFIQLRYNGDMDAAITSYEAAAQLNPDDRGIQESLNQLQQTRATLLERFAEAHR
jgi:hypothetical protein